MLKIVLVFFFIAQMSTAQTINDAILQFKFENNVGSEIYKFEGDDYSFTEGIKGNALQMKCKDGFNHLSLSNVQLNSDNDFSVQFWIKTTSKEPAVFLSQKDFKDKSIVAQKNAGWVIYSSGGTFAWSVGSGERRLSYERENGEFMPVNDGEWHQVTMTYSKELHEIRLYCDGMNKAIYKLSFDFINQNPIILGTIENNFDFDNELSPDIVKGQKQLQALVDEFNKLDIDNLKDDDFIGLITDPKELYISNLDLNSSEEEEMHKEELEILDPLYEIRKELSQNTYTVFQNRKLTLIKPISKIYFLKEGNIQINDKAARYFTENERLYPSEFSLDNLFIWDRVISAAEVMAEYTRYNNSESKQLDKELSSLTVAVWNIWHGGKHNTIEKDGWDSRKRIADILKEINADIVLMQETYSSGDYIAADLGYYFATTSDWDYCQQGSNISVLSRYPIVEVEVPEKAEFMNVSAKIVLNETQEIYAISNWYGMTYFPIVYEYHKSKFDNADLTPVLFGGDFNAVPHTDGGKSPASVKMEEAGFTDAYRSKFPDVDIYPGHTHMGGFRIDQLYFKGKRLENKTTRVISDWPGGFPSDHYLIVSEFELK